MPAAVEWHWQSLLSKHSSSRLESGLAAERGELGRKGAVTLGWVILDVHVKALTRGMWPACTLESGSQAVQHWGQVVMQSQRVLLICSHYVLVWCHTRMPPVAPAPLPHPSAEMTLVSEGRIHLQCVLYNISLTMQ